MLRLIQQNSGDGNEYVLAGWILFLAIGFVTITDGLLVPGM